VVSSAEDRISGLAAALRKITLMTLLITVVCIGTVGNSYISLQASFEGSRTEDYIVASNPEQYGAAHLITSVLHMLSVFVVLWYTWTSPSVWMNAAIRRERHTPFWATLCHGPPTQLVSFEKRASAVNAREAPSVVLSPSRAHQLQLQNARPPATTAAGVAPEEPLTAPTTAHPARATNSHTRNAW
jgi:hypothetical protein